MDTKQREAFEAAMEAKHGRQPPFLRWPGDGSYTDDRLEWAWRGYCAALAPSDAAGAPATPVELLGVEDELKRGDGFWRSCSGCHETEDGHPVGHYNHSAVLNCDLGSGCSECGGLGAVWDNTNYDAMAAAGDADEIARERADAASAPNIEDAKRMGEDGAPHSEPERLLYEAYCKGHCWAVGPWIEGKDGTPGYYYDTIDRIRFAMWRDRAALGFAAPVAPAARPTDDALWDQTLRERDNYQEWADKLANAIAAHFGVDIGEHSSANNPWSEALEAVENVAPACAPEGWARVPVERSYDMRAKAIIAFNTAEQSGNDRDDALDAAWRAMLGVAPAATAAVVPFQQRVLRDAHAAERGVSDGAGLFADDDERTLFIQTIEEFDDCNETVTDDRLLMKWACTGLLECNTYLVTERGRETFNAIRAGGEL